MKTSIQLSIFALALLAACQPSVSSTAQSTPITVLSGAASDDSETLDLSKLPAGFPIIGEVVLASKPAQCGLSKSTRLGASTPVPGETYDDRYVFTYAGMDETTNEPLYQVGVNGVLRTVKQSGSADKGDTKTRYYKTIDAPEVEILVTVDPSDDGDQVSGTFGRIKAWDGDIPLMCGYNIVKVVGVCEL